MKKTTVSFVYDEETRLWQVIVSDVNSQLEALQAFNAVLGGCAMAEESIVLEQATELFDGTYEIKPLLRNPTNVNN
jgi:hypothetical protein